MRDPAGTTDSTGVHFVRRLSHDLPASHFLRSVNAADLVSRGLLVPFELMSERLIHSRKIGFVSYPYEWTHSQLLHAATCTLDIQESACDAGYILKDATAFNVVFDGSRAEFCDLLSFETRISRHWWAYGQFLRHFLLPLAVSRYVGQPVATHFKAALDGLSIDHARQMLGRRKRWLNRIGLALLQPTGRGGSIAPPLGTHDHKAVQTHRGLLRFLRWQLEAVRQARQGPSNWGRYEDSRNHYSENALEAKRIIVGRWLSAVKPRTVIDLGCNKGEFSLMAAEYAREVIAIDSDEMCINHLRQRMTAVNASIQTVVADLDDPSPARGWASEEFQALVVRLSRYGDVVMALALLHHLVLGRGIAMAHVANFLAAQCRGCLIVELIAPDDEKVQEVCVSRNRTDAAEVFGLALQRSSLSVHFTMVEELPLMPGRRYLALMRRRDD
jgi:hypothetical protein